MKFQGFDGTSEELSSFLKNTNRDVSDIFKVKDTSRGINILISVSVFLYVASMLAFAYVPSPYKPAVTTIMIICTVAVPIVLYFKYWRLCVLFPVLLASIALTALILGVADYSDIYNLGKDATTKYIDNQMGG